MATQQDPNGWSDYQHFVLAELKRIGDGMTRIGDKLDSEILDVKVEIATLKVKAGLWGLVGASIPSSVAIIVYYLKF